MEITVKIIKQTSPVIPFLLAFILNLTPPILAKSPVPEFTHKKTSEWINSAPLKISSLKDKVILINIWTFGCWNCYRSFPWLKAAEKKFKGKPFQVIGVHSPEFDHEKVIFNIKAKIRKFGLTHPIMIDNNFSYWRSLNNRYWPAFYLIDKKSNIRKVFVGETHSGTSQAIKIENAIHRLLSE